MPRAEQSAPELGAIPRGGPNACAARPLQGRSLNVQRPLKYLVPCASSGTAQIPQLVFEVIRLRPLLLRHTIETGGFD
eukprot:4046924-Prymnesium_polylepis.1